MKNYKKIITMASGEKRQREYREARVKLIPEAEEIANKKFDHTEYPDQWSRCFADTMTELSRDL